MLEQKRYLENYLKTFPSEKLIFLSGPRGVGKSTLIKGIKTSIFKEEPCVHLNFEQKIDKDKILNLDVSKIKNLIIEEISFFKYWRSYLNKRLKDNVKIKIIATGSCKFNFMRKYWNPLLGKYKYFRLHPFSFSELNEKSAFQFKIIPDFKNISHNVAMQSFNLLLEFGGFPENILSQNKSSLKKWHNSKFERLFSGYTGEELNGKDKTFLINLVNLLHKKGNSANYLKAIQSDIGLNSVCIKAGIRFLEQNYYIFTIPPYISKYLKTENPLPKIYFTDWSFAKDMKWKLKNILASHLLKFIHYLQDIENLNVHLYYLQDKILNSELDFFLTLDQKPWFGVSFIFNNNISKRKLIYFKNALNIPRIYAVTLENKETDLENDIKILNICKFLSGLN